MKRVILVRHAKSSWDDASLPDFERPLNKRGEHDAPMMAKRLQDKKVNIDAFITSPAKRAKKTASLFAKEFDQHKDDLVVIDELYHAGVEDFFQAIEKAPAKAKTIAIFSHNPGITDFANQLTDTRVDDMPTCAIYAVKAPIDNWADFRQASREFWFFDFPKSH
jgi:phosphohistidine phosphatase